MYSKTKSQFHPHLRNFVKNLFLTNQCSTYVWTNLPVQSERLAKIHILSHTSPYSTGGFVRFLALEYEISTGRHISETRAAEGLKSLFFLLLHVDGQGSWSSSKKQQKERGNNGHQFSRGHHFPCLLIWLSARLSKAKKGLLVVYVRSELNLFYKTKFTAIRVKTISV